MPRIRYGRQSHGPEPHRLHRERRPKLPSLPAHRIPLRRSAPARADAEAPLARRDPAVTASERTVRQSLAAVPAGCAGRLAGRRRAAPPAPGRADPASHHPPLRPPGTRNPGDLRRPDDPRLHRHRVRQDRVLPLPRHQPMPRAPGRGGAARHQRGHRLSDERACRRPAHAAARGAGGHGHSVRDLRRQDPRAGVGRGGRQAAGGVVAGRL